MKRVLLILASTLLLTASTGCLHHNVRQDGAANCGAGGACATGQGGCGHCGGLLGGLVNGGAAAGIHESQGWRHQAPQLGPAGPPVGTYAYPYYTLHGPRDFLVDDPPSIGR